MDYDDFQILDDKAYEIMRENYSANQYHDRQECIEKIMKGLHEIKDCCLGVSRHCNTSIQNAVSNSLTIINKNIENLTLTFNLKSPTSFEICDFNIFTLIKKILKIQKILLIWKENESKEYYKMIAKNMLSEFIDITLNLISAIEKSNFRFFKYM